MNLQSLLDKEIEKKHDLDSKPIKKKTKKKRRMELVVECFNNGITNNKEIAKILYQNESSGNLINRAEHTVKRDEKYFRQIASWYLSQASKRGLIDRAYKPKKITRKI